jgi:ABC-type lipoprotein release transport system permease subunit
MGRLLLISRLAVKDLRYRPAQAVLLLLAIAAGAATLTLGLSLRGTTDNPYAKTQAATNGPDVVATVLTGGSNAPGPATTSKPGDTNGTPSSDQPDRAALVPLANAPGVIAYSGPFPVTWTALRKGQATGSAEVEGRSSVAGAVDQPKLRQGSWVRPGGVVVEAGFASAFGLHVGDRLNLGGTNFAVVGTAVSAAVPAYPNTCAQAEGCILTNGIAHTTPGLVWATQADSTHIAGTSGPEAYFLNLKLTDPATTQAFVDRANADTSPTAPYLLSWQQIRTGDAQTLAKVRVILTTGSWLLALLAVASVAILVGGRMVEQQRRVGLLKAVGATPWIVAGVLLFEQAIVGACAAGVGLLIGWLTAPLIDSPGAGLLGAPNGPSLDGATIALTVTLALGVACVATIVSATRASRQSTVAALNDSARRPRRRQAVIRLSGHLPAPLLLGVLLAARRPRRLLLSVFGIAVTVSGLVALMIVHATSVGFALGPGVAQATTVISVMLVVLAAVNAAFVAWTTVLDARHSAALARALGATPEQITTGLSVAQLLPALFGALLGIPGGIGFYAAARNGPGVTTLPSALSLAALVVAILIVIGVFVAVPTRLGVRRPVAEILQAGAT